MARAFSSAWATVRMPGLGRLRGLLAQSQADVRLYVEKRLAGISK